jgi:ABC-type antimicrobial peptide transport system ATPase subunit
MPPLLEVRGLHTEFRTDAGIVRVVDGISHVRRLTGEADPVSACFCSGELGIVAEMVA